VLWLSVAVFSSPEVLNSSSYFFACSLHSREVNVTTMKANTTPQVNTLRVGISPKTKRTAARLARDRGIGLNELFLELFTAIIKKQKIRNVAR
jgi:hypothetical protein